MTSPLRLISWLLFSLAALATTLSAKQLYTCGMHPQVVREEPGDCPICGMKLQPLRPGAAAPAGGAAAAIELDAATVQRMNLRTAVTTEGEVYRQFRTVGSVAFDESTLHDITTKYEGWLERLFVNTTWAQVKAGDPLFEIYSPELYNAQLNYLVALQSEPGGEGPLARAALARLRLYDLPEAFIAELRERREASRTFTYRAPSDGTVIEKMGVAGQMMKPGERIYRLANLSAVWVEAEIYEHDLSLVKPGDAAMIRVTYGPERALQGRVDLLLPRVQEQTRTATARITLPNPDGYLRPGMFVDVHFASRVAESAVLVPEMAVLRSGERNTVFVARRDGSFEPREVKLGQRSTGDVYEVLAGLHAGERVVTSGQFMLDSESQLREAIQKMVRPAMATREMPASVQPAAKPAAEPAPKRTAADPLVPLAQALADAAAPLAADDLDGYKRQLPALEAALKAYFAADAHAVHGPLAAFAGRVPDGSDLKAVRKAFAPLSTAVADLALERGVTRAAGLHAFGCPMADAHWLQRDAGLKNPFYGASMLTCGEELAPPPEPQRKSAATTAEPDLTAGLPPGHPPLDQVTLAAFGFAAAGSANAHHTAAAADRCTGCGMSGAAMAAGEPCAHAHP